MQVTRFLHSAHSLAAIREPSRTTRLWLGWPCPSGEAPTADIFATSGHCAVNSDGEWAGDGKNGMRRNRVSGVGRLHEFPTRSSCMRIHVGMTPQSTHQIISLSRLLQFHTAQSISARLPPSAAQAPKDPSEKTAFVRIVISRADGVLQGCPRPCHPAGVCRSFSYLSAGQRWSMIFIDPLICGHNVITFIACVPGGRPLSRT